MKWKERPRKILKYVDDNLQIDKICMETVVAVPPDTREKHAITCQNVFRHIMTKAESRGMRVNSSKMAMMCVSDAMSYRCLLYTSPSPRD